MGKKSKRPSRIQQSKSNTSSEKESKKMLLESLSEANSSVSSWPCGLQNLGNTCYFNSTMQAIACSRRYLEFKANELMVGDVSDRKVSVALFSFLSHIKSSKTATLTAKNTPSINPTALLSSICASNPQFRGRSQQDAHELYVCLMATLKEEFEKMMKSSASTEPANDEGSVKPRSLSAVYDGTLCSLVKCKRCESRFATCESFFDLSMPIPGSESLMTIRKFPKPLKPNKNSPAPANGSIVVDNLIPSSGDETKEDDEFTTESLDVATTSNIAEEEDTVDQKLTQLNLSTSGEDTPSSDQSITLAEDIIEAPIHQPREITHHTKLTIQDSLDLFMKEESLLVEQGNGFFCSHCRQTVDASRRLMPLTMPRCLVLHLKRLLPGGKQDIHVDFSENLDITEYIAKNRRVEDVTSSSYKYSLVSVIVHHGSGRGGHYICYTKYKGVWFYTSDSIVRRCSESEVLGSEAYMLFYARAMAHDKTDTGKTG